MTVARKPRVCRGTPDAPGYLIEWHCCMAPAGAVPVSLRLRWDDAQFAARAHMVLVHGGQS